METFITVVHPRNANGHVTHWLAKCCIVYLIMEVQKKPAQAETKIISTGERTNSMAKERQVKFEVRL